jgi:hypothetical protein
MTGQAKLSEADLGSAPLQDKSEEQSYNSARFHPNNNSQPSNAFVVKSSRFMKREDRDLRLYRSPSHDDYLFPKTEMDLFNRFKDSFLLDEVFDELADEPIRIRELTTKLLWREDELRDKMTKLVTVCAAAGRPIDDAKFAVEVEIRDLFNRCEELQKEVEQFKEQIVHARKHKTEGTNKRPRLVSLSHNALLQKAIPPRKFVLKPWLPEAAISMVFAPPGVGKSYLCLSAAGAIARGGQLFKTSPWIAPEPKRVLYVDGEMHEADLQIRVKKLLSNIEENIPDDYLHYINGSWQENFIPDLSSIEGQKLLEERLFDQGAQVLFLDNLSTLCRAGRENETDSWKQMQTWLLQLRWRGIAVVLVHHAGKAKDENGKPRQRGTSMREVVLESSIVLDHPKDYSEEMGCLFELSYVKARGFWGADAIPLEVRLVEKDGAFMWEDRKLCIKTYDSVVGIYNEGTTSTREIANELGISPQAVRKHIRTAKKEGDIK